MANSLVACSDPPTTFDPRKPLTIAIWHYYHGTQKSAFDSAIKEFNETVGYKTGIIVEAVSYGGVNELAENVLAAARGELDAGQMPNIFGSYGDTAFEILKLGKIIAIDPYLSGKELSAYEDSFIREGRFGLDHLYVFPIAKSTESLMINKTDFDAFLETLSVAGGESIGYDDLTTWEGILQVAEIYHQKTGKAFMSIDTLANYIIVGSKQLGQDIVQVKDGKATFHLDPLIMRKLWDTYYEPMVKGWFTKLGRFGSDDVKTGDSLCYIGSSASASYFPVEIPLGDDTARTIELMVLPMPVFENGAKVAVSQGAGMAIAASTPEKEYASAFFLKWFTEPERNVSFSLSSGYLPVKKAALDDAFLQPVFDSIEQNQNALTQNNIKTLQAGIHQLKTYTLYTSDVFDGGLDFRNNLPVGLSNAAQDGRIAFLAMQQAGASPEEAYASLEAQSTAQYDQWILSLGE